MNLIRIYVSKKILSHANYILMMSMIKHRQIENNIYKVSVSVSAFIIQHNIYKALIRLMLIYVN
jgi:hypothetical protein